MYTNLVGLHIFKILPALFDDTRPGDGRLTAGGEILTEGALLDSGRYLYYISTSLVNRRSICVTDFLDVEDGRVVPRLREGSLTSV